MDASMWVAKTGLDAQQTRMNVISNNLANVNTSGFKRDRAVFEDLLYQNVRQAGGQTGTNTQAPTGLMLGTGVRVVATEKLHSQGNMVTRAGHKVFPGIVVPPNIMKISISENGNVEAFTRESVEPINLGQVPIFTFVNPVGLRSEGGNLMGATAGSGQAMQNIPGQNGSGMLMQGAIETSNVNVMNEMTDLIKAQRAYEMNSKVMGVADQMLQTVNNIR